MPESKALEINLETSRVDVTPDAKYGVLLDITSEYYGLRDGLEAFLKEVCHPYKNWQYIVNEARRFSLNNIELFREHPRGPRGIRLFLDIFFSALAEAKGRGVRAEAMDNLVLSLKEIITETDDDLPRFVDVLQQAFEQLAGSRTTSSSWLSAGTTTWANWPKSLPGARLPKPISAPSAAC